MKSKFLICGALFMGASAFAGKPGDKRTIITSGDKVHPIRFHLGQSTILYLGLKPDTVICGNKNYFNVEKIKEGVTIQPLANFPTNLTILDKDRRYLFYLVPAGAGVADSFVDVKWIAQAEVLPVEPMEAGKFTQITELNQRVKVSLGVELVLLRKKVVDGSRKLIFEVELKNHTADTLKTENLAVIAMSGRQAVRTQAVVWEDDAVKSKKVLKGRLIVAGLKGRGFELVVRHKGRDTRTTIKGGVH